MRASGRPSQRHAVAVERDAALREEHRRVTDKQPMLERQQTRRKRGRCVAGFDREFDLRDDRAAVELRRDEMHARAVHRIAGRDRALVRLESAIFRQQRRMDVDRAADPWRKHAGIENAHEAREHDEIRRVRGDAREEIGIEARAIGIAARIERERRDAGRLGEPQRLCFGPGRRRRARSRNAHRARVCAAISAPRFEPRPDASTTMRRFFMGQARKRKSCFAVQSFARGSGDLHAVAARRHDLADRPRIEASVGEPAR